ncbi:MAG: hypothetical protein KAR84_03090 [Elusimicrobiales bacterium]|nr:hypothetical protein [Elusimicrobiales bacterium]MCK5106016.1 hypothetical protein [Elusimicrobiales bacterium]
MLETAIKYKIMEFPNLYGMPGFTKEMITNHMKLYQGYVTNTNTVLETMNSLLDRGKGNTPEYAELKRRFGWEFNGMRLHELYFSNIGRTTELKENSVLYKKIHDEFWGYESWKKDFVATGMMRGVGWAVLCKDPNTNKLFNTWINEHDGGGLVGCNPILVMDMFEHAYTTDYKLDKRNYIDAFFNIINWEEASNRFMK